MKKLEFVSNNNTTIANINNLIILNLFLYF